MNVSITERQRQMIENPATILYIGAGTKTGKTIGLLAWVMALILQGKKTAWIGSVSDNTRAVYAYLKRMLAWHQTQGIVHFNDTMMKVTSTAGGTFSAYTGVDPQPVFGNAFDGVVIDEASRQTEMSLSAAITTISARPGGQIKLAFNLEKGAQNWAVRKFVQVRDMDPAERAERGVDYMTMPTLDEAFVKPEFVAMMQDNMPEAMFRALYYAEIPDSDLSLFRNLDEIFSGPIAVTEPERAHAYVMGVDLARKKNWTVCTVIDATTDRLVDADRFHQISWELQYAKIEEMARKWKVASTLVDQSGLGDPVVETLQKRNFGQVDGYVLSEQSRKALLERLIVACDGQKFHGSDDPRFRRHKSELGRFEYALNEKTGHVTYKVPQGEHDDAGISLALTWWQKTTAVYGSPTIRSIRTAQQKAERNLAAY